MIFPIRKLQFVQYFSIFFSLPWHCEKGCEFDLCYGCTKSHKSAAHRHPLQKSNPKKSYPTLPGWKCDICGEDVRHEEQEKPYHCKTCHYDLCQNCMEGDVVKTIQILILSTTFFQCLYYSDCIHTGNLMSKQLE